jgi:putative flippase GtrA
MENLKEISKILFTNETTNWGVQLIRYVFVGGFAFVVDYGLLLVLTELGHFHYLISATISFIAGLIVNYIISTKWIFTKSKISSTTIEFMIYSIIGVIGLLLNDLLMYFFTEWIHIHYLVSKLITAAIVMGWNFIGRRTILFNS